MSRSGELLALSTNLTSLNESTTTGILLLKSQRSIVSDVFTTVRCAVVGLFAAQYTYVREVSNTPFNEQFSSNVNYLPTIHQKTASQVPVEAHFQPPHHWDGGGSDSGGGASSGATGDAGQGSLVKCTLGNRVSNCVRQTNSFGSLNPPSTFSSLQ